MNYLPSDKMILKCQLDIALKALEQMVNYNSEFHPLLPRIQKCAYALDEINDPEFAMKLRKIMVQQETSTN